MSINRLISNTGDWNAKKYYSSGEPDLSGVWLTPFAHATSSHLEGLWSGPRVSGNYTCVRDDKLGEFEASYEGVHIRYFSCHLNACVSEEIQLDSSFADNIYDYVLTVNHEAPVSVRLNTDWAVNTGGNKVVTQLTDTTYSGPLQVTDVHLANFPANFPTATWQLYLGNERQHTTVYSLSLIHI